MKFGFWGGRARGWHVGGAGGRGAMGGRILASGKQIAE
jgi:hypothetical protein